MDGIGRVRRRLDATRVGLITSSPVGFLAGVELEIVAWPVELVVEVDRRSLSLIVFRTSPPRCP
jgi:hypothetical protein